MTMAIIGVVGSVAAGSLVAMRAEARALGGARYLAARLGEERTGAVGRGATGGLFFTRFGRRYVFQRVIDGNGNGLRSEDVEAGVDRLLDAPVSIDTLFPGITFAVVRPVTAVDGEGPGLAEGADPVRIGGTRFVSFSPAGTGSSGTLYLGTAERRQLAVRLFGATGRVRVFEFSAGEGRWVPR